MSKFGIVLEVLKRLTYLFAIALALTNSPLVAQSLEILNPATYRSPGGRFELKIDPTNRYGGGAAQYSFFERGKKLWEKKLPFSLWNAGVTDQGIVGGFAFTKGAFGGQESRQPFARVKNDGVVRSEIQPQYPDGKLVTVLDFQLSPAGKLWMNDGNCFVQLNDRGVTEKVLGIRPQSSVLQEVAGVVCDSNGQIFAVDERTGSIHVFDSNCQPMYVCQAKPSDFKDEVFSPAITVNLKGEVYLGLGESYVGDDELRSSPDILQRAKGWERFRFLHHAVLFSRGRVTSLQYATTIFW